MNKIVQLFAENSALAGVCYVIVFLLLVVGFFLLFSNILIMRSAKNNLNKIKAGLYDANSKRIMELEKERRTYGTTGKQIKKSSVSSFLERIDDVIVYSGIEVKFEWLNTTTYLFFTILGFALVFMVLNLFGLSVVYAGFWAITIAIAPYIYLGYLRDKNLRDTEDNLKSFISLVANMGADTNDLILIFERCAPYVLNPIRSVIYRGISRARVRGGNLSDCIELMTREIEHPLFVRFIRALDMANKTDANYSNIARDFSDQAEREIRSMERRRAIFANGRAEIFILAVIGFAIIPMMCSFIEQPFFKVVNEMTGSLFGIGVLIIEGVIYGGLAIYLISGSRK